MGFSIVITTFYISTLDKVPVLWLSQSGLGGTNGDIAAVLGVQVFVVSSLGSAIAGAGFGQLWPPPCRVR